MASSRTRHASYSCTNSSSPSVRPPMSRQAHIRPNHQRLALMFFKPNIISRVQEKEFRRKQYGS